MKVTDLYHVTSIQTMPNSGRKTSPQVHPTVTDKEVDLRRTLGKNYFSAKDALKIIPVSHPKVYLFMVPELDAANGFQIFKVGDTSYENVQVRLNQWRKEGYSTLVFLGEADAFFDVPMKNNPNVSNRYYFRDYEIHKWLLANGFLHLWHSNPNRDQLESYVHPDAINTALDTNGKPTVSQEFFVSRDFKKAITVEVIEQARQAIIDDFLSGGNKYSVGTTVRREASIKHYDEATDFFMPRTYQRTAVIETFDKFWKSQSSSQKVLLDAPTRSGKCFMLLWTIKAILSGGKTFDEEMVFSNTDINYGNNTLTIIVSGIPDVFNEILRATEKHDHFRNSFCYLHVDEVVTAAGAGQDLIQDKWDEGFHNVILSVSLQNLAGRKNDGGGDSSLKKIHKMIKNKTTLVVGDEAHFGIFGEGESYKLALTDKQKELTKQEKSELTKEERLLENALEESRKNNFHLNPELGFIFATATTYNILGQGAFRFPEEVIFVSQEKINAQITKDLAKFDDPTKSSFYGIPPRFFFGIKTGIPASMLFSANQDGFIYEKEARQAIEALYGIGSYKDVPPLLADAVLNEGGAGRHIFIQAPSKIACDAFENLFNEIKTSHPEVFGDQPVTVFNISSSNDGHRYTKAKSSAIIDKIHNERFNRTVTITVNRLGTGVTVPEWDTVILANNGQSLTRRIQTYGRVASPWTETTEYENEDGTITEEKICLKPNCFVIDFSPNNLYEIQNDVEIHINSLDPSSVNIPQENRLPALGETFIFNGTTLVSLTLADLHKKLDEYLKESKIPQLVSRIQKNDSILSGLDDAYFDDIQPGKNKKKLTVTLTENAKEIANRKTEEESTIKTDDIEGTEGAGNDADDAAKTEEERLKTLEEKKKALQEKVFEKILLFSTLIDGEITSVGGIVNLLTVTKDPIAIRIAKNIELMPLLNVVENIKNAYPVVESLERSMKAVQVRSNDGTGGYLETIEGLSRLSSNEIFTPKLVAEKLKNTLELSEADAMKFLNSDNAGVIDVGDKSGNVLLEFSNEMESLLPEANKERNLKTLRDEKIFSIPTSNVSYEIVRKFYEKMNWNTENIFWNQDIADMDVWLRENWAYAFAMVKLDRKLDKILNKDVSLSFEKWVDGAMADNKKFDYCISNPPYQIIVGGTKYSIYQQFFLSAQKISKKNTMIFPVGWQKSSGVGSGSTNDPYIRSDKQISSLDNYFEEKDSPIILFPTADPGGVNIINWSKDHDNKNEVQYSEYGITLGKRNISTFTSMDKKSQNIFFILQEWLTNNDISSMKPLLTRKIPFGLRTYILSDSSREDFKYVNESDGIKFLGKIGTRNIFKYIQTSAPSLRLENSEKWKVAWSRTGPKSQYRTVELFPPHVIFAEQWMGLFFNSKKESENFNSYFQTLFYRFQLAERSVSPTVGGRSLHQTVPDLSATVNPRTKKVGWGSDWTDEDLKLLFKDVLTEEDWTYIEKTAIESDPVGAKKNK